MLVFLRGQVLAKPTGSVIIENNNLGYRVFVNEALLDSWTIGQTIELFIFHHLKEDAEDLYGFTSADQLALFELLLSVSGIGPKSALNILSLAEIGQLHQAIALGDEAMLTQVPGIGSKTAQRLILELKNKINTISFSSDLMDGSRLTTQQDELEALISLGYGVVSARQALAKIDPQVTDSAERLKLALQQLS